MIPTQQFNNTDGYMSPFVCNVTRSKNIRKFPLCPIYPYFRKI